MAAPAETRRIPHGVEIVRAVTACLVAAAVVTCAACSQSEPPEERLRHGARLFEEQGCIVCHGREGHGDGVRSASLYPRPRDFRDASAYVQGTSARAIASTLETGIRVRDAQMPSFSHLAESERLALGEFIVSLRRDAIVAPH